MAQSAGGEAGTHLTGTGTDCARRDGTPSVPGHELSGVVEGARRVHPGTHEAPRDSGRDPVASREPVVRVHLAVGLDDHVLGRPQPGDGGLPAQSDVVVAVVAGPADPVRLVPLAQRNALGQRREFVRFVGPLLERGDLTIKTLFAQGDGGRCASEDGAHDQG